MKLAGDGDDMAALEALDAREKEVWRQLWHLPQAVAWHMPEYAYLVQTVAMYTRAVVRAEQSFANAADRTVLLRYADMIGMTPNGLARLGWLIVEDDEPNTKPQLHVVTPSAYTDPRDEWEAMEEDVWGYPKLDDVLSLSWSNGRRRVRVPHTVANRYGIPVPAMTCHEENAKKTVLARVMGTGRA